MRAQRVTDTPPATPTTNTSDPVAEIAAIVAEMSPHSISALLAQARIIRDEERRRGTRPPLMSLSLRDFVARVQETADRAIVGTYGSKVFVAALYRLFEERGETSGFSLAEFKDRLMTAHRANLLVLERGDGVELPEPMMVKSEIKYLGGVYHFVARKGR